jgi:hypothetical protein
VAADDPVDVPESGRAADQLWGQVRIDPIEIALPGGVGYTLRAYRLASELTPAEEPAEGEEAEPELDEFEAASAAVLRRRRTEDSEVDARADTDEFDEESEDDDADDTDESEEDEDEDEADEDEDDEDEADDEAEEEAEVEDEELPLFLARRGRLYLFHSPEKLVEFVRSAPEHDLAQLPAWSDLTERITTDDVVAQEDDTYELDLVVDNLRGGPDAWDPPLILKAGELARDLGHALRIPAVMAALGPGSPLDDLDEALRAAEAGGVGGFFAKRRLRKIPAQQTSLAWRTVIGKISAIADWRD